jgi:hypothetical protein
MADVLEKVEHHRFGSINLQHTPFTYLSLSHCTQMYTTSMKQLPCISILARAGAHDRMTAIVRLHMLKPGRAVLLTAHFFAVKDSSFVFDSHKSRYMPWKYRSFSSGVGVSQGTLCSHF